MRVIVTGASGFIGQPLCAKLLEHGHEVVALCRTFRPPESSNLQLFKHIPYVMGDQLPQKAISFTPEVVVNLAWDGIPDFSERKCLDNVESQLQFLKQTEKLTQVKKIVSAGTCREYGAKEGACMEMERVQPDSYFSWAKQTLAEYFRLACQQRQIDLVWLRNFYVYGPGQRTASLIPSLVKAFQARLMPDIKNPSTANDYIYIDDVVSAFVKSVENRDCCGTFNLGSGSTTTVAEIAEIVEKIILKESHFSSDLCEYKECHGSPLGIWADTSSARDQLGWTPETNLSQGIEYTCKSLRKEHTCSL
jgi:nucleoside-diphosphate-sugar epimerase